MYATDITPKAAGSARERILFLLKVHGPQTAEQLAKRLAVTTMAIRQHLSTLEAEILVTFTDIRHKVGRPSRLWQLTPQAYNKFPDCHAGFATGMIESIRRTFGEDGLERLIEERTQEQVQNYSTRMPDLGTPIEERVAALAKIRCEEGYMAEWKKYGSDGEIEFVENHCSIANAASLCSKLCTEELSLFRTILGDGVSINRVEHILAGDRRCVYRVTKSRR